MKLFTLVKTSLLMLSALTLVACGNTNDQNESSSSEEQTSQIASNESNSEENTENKYNLSEEQLKEVNAYLSQSLEEDHNFALGKLDENGNPTENGTPDPDMQYSLNITDLSFDNDGVLVAQVDPNFMELPENERHEIASQLQGKGELALMMKANIQPEDHHVFLSVRFNSDILGHSNMSNPSEIEWNK